MSILPSVQPLPQVCVDLGVVQQTQVADPGEVGTVVGAVEELLAEAERVEPLELPIDLRETSYVIVRVIESYIYLDLITGEDPDASRAGPVFRLLLRA